MSRRTIGLSEELHRYLLGTSLREVPLQRRLREETAALPNAQMQISPDQGQFMALLVRLIGARRILEIGTFTGYSALAMALAMPADGRLVACDINAEWTAIGRRYWTEAGVGDRIDLHLAPALATLDQLLVEGCAGSFDLAFIDADKESYAAYYERALELLRPGGLILVDNTLWNGAVADPARNDPDTVAIRAFNAACLTDERIDFSLLPIGDGLTLARKREVVA
ncbi:class I SAM-dependent methyltransferase [Defluviicoccus vanus]|uniref:Class I SAM-dependent methyltransferase n=1 Tax=Defluviicoccus vanus TaxID=111831 RepID=A0A7H1N256_9PROT|nr:class I SAM-dependent methyltransferase [Defluviicoccus vanus]QNT69792.1 class I SAM-dependent methyltransferase [Defluviicoccus vanus]